jgi:hypothetical protein
MEQLAKLLPADKFEPKKQDADDRNIFERVKDIFG